MPQELVGGSRVEVIRIQMYGSSVGGVVQVHKRWVVATGHTTYRQTVQRVFDHVDENLIAMHMVVRA